MALSPFARASALGLGAAVLGAALPLLAGTVTPVAAQTPAPGCAVVPTPTPTPTPTASASASATATATPTATPTATTSPTPAPGCAFPPRTPTPTPVPPGGNPEVQVLTPEIAPGVRAEVRVTGRPGDTVALFAYSRPSTEYRVVRRGVLDSDGVLVLGLLPGTNTRVYASYDRPGSDGPSAVIDVRTALSLSAVRTAVRTYVLQGRVLPRRAGQLVSVYRQAGGREVLTVQARTDGSGTYRVSRTFTGTGTSALVSRTGRNLTNVAGTSAVLRLSIR